jgi:hypothetical protein
MKSILKSCKAMKALRLTDVFLVWTLSPRRDLSAVKAGGLLAPLNPIV